jgi:hypothetical protein
MTSRSRLYVLLLCLAGAAGWFLGLPLLPLAAWAALELASAAAAAARVVVRPDAD